MRAIDSPSLHRSTYIFIHPCNYTGTVATIFATFSLRCQFMQIIFFYRSSNFRFAYFKLHSLLLAFYFIFELLLFKICNF